MSRCAEEIKIGLPATLHFYLWSSGNLDLCALLRAAAEMTNVKKSEELSQFAGLTQVNTQPGENKQLQKKCLTYVQI